MKSVLLLSYFIVLTLMISGIVEGTINFVSLINDVYNKYSTGSVILVPATTFFFPENISALHSLSEDLSARGISSLILHYMQLERGIKYHGKESHRPLVVIFLDELKALHKFSEGVQHVDISYSQQLVVFFGDSDKDHCEYCRKPIGNPFNLKVDSKMLVMCCGSEYIEEWWSKEENRTSTMPRGEWIEGLNEVNWYPEETIVTNRLSMDNRGFRIVTIEEEIFVWRENNELKGYIGEIFMELSRHMNFSISAIVQENIYGGRDLGSSVVTGAIGKIVRGDADVGVADFSMTSERMDYIDFTVPLLTVKRALLIKRPHRVDIMWNACFKPFHGKVWIAIIIFLLITPLLLTIIKYRRKDNLFDMISEHYLNIWGIFCRMPLPDSPYGASLRIVYISAHMMAVVSFAAYSASFISHLTTTSSYLPFHTWEEFAEDGTYKLALYGNLASGFTKTDKKLYEKLKAKMSPMDSFPNSRAEGLEQICTQKLAFYDVDIINDNDPCEIVPIPVGGMENYALILPLENEYTRTINYFLHQFEYNGMITRLKDKHFKKEDATHTYYEPVTSTGILPILIVSAVGFLMSLVIFCIELSRIRG